MAWKVEKELDEFSEDKLTKFSVSDRGTYMKTVFSYVSGQKYWLLNKWKVAVERMKDDELMQIVETKKSVMKKTLWKYESGIRYWEMKVYKYPKKKVIAEGKKKV